MTTRADIEQNFAETFDAINAISVNEEPFPHMYSDDIMPLQLFQALTENLPDNDSYLFGAYSGDKEIGSEALRGVIDFSRPESLERLPEEIRGFWSDVNTNANITGLANCLIHKFKLSDRLAAISEQKNYNVSARFFLFRDLPGYELAPHTDIGDKLATLLFYLPTKELEAGHGTTVLKAKVDPPRQYSDHKSRFYREDFETVLQPEFKGNFFFSFLPCDNSYHCVDKISDAVKQRDVLMFNIFLR